MTINSVAGNSLSVFEGEKLNLADPLWLGLHEHP